MSRPRLTNEVRAGLGWMFTFAESWLEVDGGDTVAGLEEDGNGPIEAQIEAARRWVNEGGLSTPARKVRAR